MLRIATFVNILAGVWLAVSPWILGYWPVERAIYVSLAVGTVVAFFSLFRVLFWPVVWLSWFTIMHGAFLIAAPFFLRLGPAEGGTNLLVVGIVVLVMSAISAMTGEPAYLPEERTPPSSAGA